MAVTDLQAGAFPSGAEPAAKAVESDAEVPPIPTAEQAVRLTTLSRRSRALARKLKEDRDDPRSALYQERDAAFMEARAAEGFDPAARCAAPLQPGRGGEMVPRTKDIAEDQPWLLDTVTQRPDMLVAEASVKRMELADAAGALVLGVEMAETIRATNSAEKALAHQLAAAHRMAMRLTAKADDFLIHTQSFYPAARQQIQSIEATRCANAAARLMETYQRGLLTLERLRNRGRRVLIVQHVNVAEGGRAVVAGAIERSAAGESDGAE